MSHIVIQDALYNSKSVRQLDRLAIQQLGIPSIVLMKRAGRAAFDELLDAWGAPSLITVFCGSGNNAGDGYIVAALAAEKGISVRVIELAAKEKLSVFVLKLKTVSCPKAVNETIVIKRNIIFFILVDFSF